MGIPLSECKNGYTYKIHSRNLSVGVFRAQDAGFVGIREKFGDHFLFAEFHHDTGAPYGTVTPEQEIEKCPIEDLREHVGDFCQKCEKEVKFHRENKDGTGKWRHVEKGDCPEDRPYGTAAYAKINAALYGYLEKLTERKRTGLIR